MVNKEKEQLFKAEQVRQELSYDPESGELTWLVTQGKKHAGFTAGCLHKDGYIYVTFHRCQFLAHRVIWLIERGVWPEAEIDHEDRIKSNNRWKNLREASSSQNQWNKIAYANNPLKTKGVTKRPGRPGFRARIRKNGLEFHLGNFADMEEACTAYVNAAKELHGAFGRSS